MKTDYCAYPPQTAIDVNVTEQSDNGRPTFIIGSAAAGRYILLRETEYKVLGLLSASLAPTLVCEEFRQRYGGTLPTATLIRFLTRLDQVGILAGERVQGPAPSGQQLSQQVYVRFKLFDPEPLFERMVPGLRWVWTVEFFGLTASLMLLAAVLSLMNWAEVASYGGYILREHYAAVFVASWLVVVSHEFAHGLTCKAFGGRVTEVGVLLVYYFLPGLYCNVSGIHLIPQRGRRLWVIAAGIYWQLMVATSALLTWFVVAPHTAAADLAYILFLGSVLNIVFNANPLIKLDGYYFLSQWLRLPNLVDRSRAYWWGLLRRMFLGERNSEAARFNSRERIIFTIYCPLALAYTVGLRTFIVFYVGTYLTDRLHLPGLLLTLSLALFYTRQTLRNLLTAAIPVISTLFSAPKESKMATKHETTRHWRHRLVPLSILLLVAAGMCLPWSASIGNYGTLMAIPGREAIIRAPESATLIELQAKPGATVTSGGVLGRLGNLELEEQIVQVQSDLARVGADYDRLIGELNGRRESAVRAELQLRQREHDYDEIDSEQRQIQERRRVETIARPNGSMIVSASVTAIPQNDAASIRYPAAIGVLQSDVEARGAQLEEAKTRRDRARQLYSQGVMPRSELDTAQTQASTLALEFEAARERLEAALIDHRRRYVSATTEMDVARSDVGAERLQAAKLNGELGALNSLVRTLQERRDLLVRKRAQFGLVTPQPGTVFGEELPRMVGQYFQKGAEICRVADTRQMLVRIQVPEREIGDIRVGHPVRLKSRSFPERIFHGVVSRIGGESEPDEYRQATYRVELTVENEDGVLRPGMTAFARIDFGRQMIGRILLHKIKQALRPELWMF